VLIMRIGIIMRIA